MPDPAVAASALGALGYFAKDPDYGIELLHGAASNGAKQVSTPDDVVTGVAEGTYAAGITIANSAYAAKENGSPIEVAWPSPGAVAIYGPVALAEKTDNAARRKNFISYVASKEGQELIGGVRLLPDPGRRGGPDEAGRRPGRLPGLGRARAARTRCWRSTRRSSVARTLRRFAGFRGLGARRSSRRRSPPCWWCCCRSR